MAFALDPAAIESIAASTAEVDVGVDQTAIAVGSGDLPVLATPVMIALMEAAACQGLAAHLPPGYTSVGSHVDVRHLAPSALGAHVTARAEVVGIQGSRVIFDVSARHDTPDGPVEIGSGRHVRVIVRRDAFLDPS